MLEGELGVAAADGGELIEHPMNVLPEDRWGSVVTSFLGATAPTSAPAEHADA